MNHLKFIISHALHISGIFYLWGRFFFARKAFILMYHRVLTNDELKNSPVNVQPGMYVTPSTFESHVKYLIKKNYTIVFLSELADLISQKKDISRCCVITFDDGWIDNYTNMLPILKKYNVKATIFITSGFTGTNKLFWPEEVALYIDTIVELDYLERMLKILNLNLDDTDKVRNSDSLLKDTIISHLKSFSHNQRIELIKSIKNLAASSQQPNHTLLMGWNEINEMVASGLVEFGSHTVNHELLDKLDNQDIKFEIQDSMSVLADRLGMPCKTLSYPNGNYNDNVLSIVQDTTLQAAVTTQRGYVTSNTNLLTLPRIAIHEDVSCNLPLFQWRLSVR
ncbi:MAG: polysaccharide deacetylase family protein [Candidatus Thiodiazotropha sp.]